MKSDTDNKGFLDEVSWSELIGLNLDGIVAALAIHSWWNGGGTWPVVAVVWCAASILSRWLTVIRRAELKKLFAAVENAYAHAFFSTTDVETPAETRAALQRAVQEARLVRLSWGIE